VQFIVLPQPSLTVPQRFTFCFGLHISGWHIPVPPSLGGWTTHLLATHVWPVGQPPQLIGTPHGSTPISPHCPVHDGVVWQLCEPFGPVVHVWPFAQGMPHTSVFPVQSVY
jgi:hypothetical protein